MVIEMKKQNNPQADSEEDYLTADEQSEHERETAGQSEEKVTAADANGSEDNDSDDDGVSSSDDEAPQEETVAASKEQHMLKEKELQQIQARESGELKARRRAQDTRFRQQKQGRKKVEVPDVLPEDLLDELEEEEEKDDVQTVATRPVQATHKTFGDDAAQEERLLDMRIRNTKKRIVREMNRTQKVVGQINVQLLNSQKKKTALAPAASASAGCKTGSVVGLRNKWMKRNSLQKKRRY